MRKRTERMTIASMVSLNQRMASPSATYTWQKVSVADDRDGGEALVHAGLIAHERLVAEALAFHAEIARRKQSPGFAAERASRRKLRVARIVGCAAADDNALAGPGLATRSRSSVCARSRCGARQVPQYVTWAPKPGGAGAA